MIDPRFYELVSHLWRGGSYSYHWTPDTDEGKLSIWFQVAKPKEVNPLWTRINVYFGVHPSRKQGGMRERAKLEDIEAVNCLFAEFDLAEGQSPEHLLAAIMSLDNLPSVVVFSGGGYHCFWLLEQTYHIDSPEARQRIMDIQYAWVDFVGSDNAAKDLVRVLRVPGTYNRKPEYDPDFPQVQIVHFDLDRTYQLDEFTTLIEPLITVTKERRVAVANADVVSVDLDDQTIIEKMLVSDVTASSLWNGDLSAYDNDHSAADMALCNKLAFWFGRDPERMDRIFRRSALYRDKWLRNDYRKKTIDKAIAECANTYTPSEKNLGNADALVKEKPPPVAVPINGRSQSTATATPAPAKKQKVKSDQYLQALHDLGYQFRLNGLDDTIEVNGRKLSDVVAAQIRTHMRDLGFDHMTPIEDAYLTRAAAQEFHPVKTYLQGLKWDGGDYITLLSAFVRDDHKPIVYPDGTERTVFNAWFRRWLVGAVAKVFVRAQNPMLVLDGGQGIGKSTFAHKIGGVLPELFIESSIRPDDKEYDRYLATKWIWEVAEVGSTTRRQDAEALKHFLTKEDVTFRIPWGKSAITKPALSSFIGTINNETGFLTDITGSRRFISVRLLSIDWSYRLIDMHQIWAQAYALWKSGEPYTLSPEEIETRTEINSEYQVEDPYEAWILRYYEVDPDKKTWKLTSNQIADLLQVRGIRGETRAIQMGIAKSLKNLGVKQDSNGRPRLWRGIKEKMVPVEP